MHRLEKIILRNSVPIIPRPTDTKAQLHELSEIKAVLFDVYGTLMISGSGDVGTASTVNNAGALEQALAASGFTGDLQKAECLGQGLMKKRILAWHQKERESGVEFPEVEILKIWKDVTETLFRIGALRTRGWSLGQLRRLGVEYECRVNPVFPMPGCIETLMWLKKQEFLLGIVSNAQYYTSALFSAFFEKSVKEIGFEPGCCIWSYKERQAKPTAALFAKASAFIEKNRGIKPSETVYVGNDMLNDIYAADRAGCKTVLFAGDARSLRLRKNDVRCAGLKPDAVITSLRQLTEIIEPLNRSTTF